MNCRCITSDKFINKTDALLPAEKLVVPPQYIVWYDYFQNIETDGEITYQTSPGITRTPEKNPINPQTIGHFMPLKKV